MRFFANAKKRNVSQQFLDGYAYGSDFVFHGFVGLKLV
jgi:hypothetical protein